MIVPLRDDLFGVRHPFVWSYLLIDGDDVIAIDCGFGPTAQWIEKWFARTGRPPRSLKAILLTHGHLDHAGCANRMRRWSGAKVHLHPDDREVLQGRFRYQKPSRIVGVIERIGRAWHGFRAPIVDVHLEDGQILPFWGGLEVLHTPGHTPGHVGFYSRSKRLLFIGDAVIYPRGRCKFPLSFLNVDNQRLRESVRRLAPLDVEWVYPMHHRELRHNLMRDIRIYAESQGSTARALSESPNP